MLTLGGWGPKFVKTWRNTWTLPNHEILSPDAGFFDKGRCQRHHEQGYLQIGNDHKAFVPLKFWEKLFVPPPKKKECQKGHDALEIIHRPLILPKWIENYFCNPWKVPQLGDTPNKMEDSNFGPKLSTKIDLNTTQKWLYTPPPHTTNHTNSMSPISQLLVAQF